MRRLASLLVVASLLAAIDAVSAFASTVGVSWKVGTAKTVTIKKGGTVKWTWADSAPHNVKGAGFKSALKAKKGYTYSHRFNSRGTFRIICQVHPSSMKTTVKVK